jgi:ABC-2 type transport system permease protein
MSPRDRSALAALFVHGWRGAAAARATTVGRIALLVLILLVFWAMWNATPLGELGPGHPTVAQMFWYLAATETIAMSVGYPYRIVETEIHNGEITTHFLRPLHYVSATLASWLGDMTHRFIAIAAAATLAGVIVTRTIPYDVATGAALLAGLWVACAMLLVSQLCVGLLATWMKSAAPAFWVWQKFLFVLGGLMIPLTLYPAWLKSIAFGTPFPSMMFLPASLVFDASVSSVATLFASQAFWLLLLVSLAAFMYARMDAHLTVRGA